MMRTDFFNKQATLVSERQSYRCYFLVTLHLFLVRAFYLML